LINVVLFLIAAGMLMHGARLKMKWDFEGWPDYLDSATGAAVKGVFLLLLGSGAFSLGCHRCALAGGFCRDLPLRRGLIVPLCCP